jgi:hypothetical protein
VHLFAFFLLGLQHLPLLHLHLLQLFLLGSF